MRTSASEVGLVFMELKVVTHASKTRCDGQRLSAILRQGSTGGGPRWPQKQVLAGKPLRVRYAREHAPLDPDAWRVAWRRSYKPGSVEASADINAKELGAAVDGVRWASRAPRTRRCRLVVQSDNADAVCWLRKGRSSRPGPLRHCRRLAAVTLAEQIAVEARHVRTHANMADQPSRGERVPGPCAPPPDSEPGTPRGAELLGLALSGSPADL